MSNFTLASLIVFLWFALAGGPALAQVKSNFEGKAGPEIESSQSFFELDPMNIPVVRDARIRGQITFMVMLELYSEDERDAVIEALPRLRHAFFLDLKQYVDRHRDILRTIKLRVVKKLLLESSTQVLGRKIVRAVLVQGASIHRF